MLCFLLTNHVFMTCQVPSFPQTCYDESVRSTQHPQVIQKLEILMSKHHGLIYDVTIRRIGASDNLVDIRQELIFLCTRTQQRDLNKHHLLLADNTDNLLNPFRMVLEKSFVCKHFRFDSFDTIEFITTDQQSFSGVSLFQEIIARLGLWIEDLFL
jgi:hypothetical protein